MISADKNNVTKYSDVNRKLTRLEADINFQELKNVIDDVEVLDVEMSTKVEDAELQSVKDNLQSQISNLETAIGGSSTIRTIIVSEFFSGDGVETEFTLSEAVIDQSTVSVYLSDTPVDVEDYIIFGNTLTFNTAPPAGTNNIQVARRIAFEYYELLKTVQEKLVASNNLSDLTDKSEARANLGVDTKQKMTSEYYGDDEPTETWPGLVWADRANNIRWRRSDDDTTWINEGQLFYPGVTTIPFEEIPLENIGPIYVPGVGNMEWDVGLNAYVARAGGATGGGSDQVFYEADTEINTPYTITSGRNAITPGPISINAEVTVLPGSVWTIV